MSQGPGEAPGLGAGEGHGLGQGHEKGPWSSGGRVPADGVCGQSRVSLGGLRGGTDPRGQGQSRPLRWVLSLPPHRRPERGVTP